MNALHRALRALVAAAGFAGVLAYAAAALLTVGDVIGRQLGMPIVGVVDLVQLFVLGGAWLVIPYAFLTGAHVGVDLLVNAMPAALRGALRVIAGAAAVALLAAMLVYCYEAFQQQMLYGDTSQQLGIPIIYYWLPLLAGVGLSILAAVLSLLPAPTQEAAR